MPDLIVANGVNGLTGEYLLPPATPAQLAGLATGGDEDGAGAWLKSVTDKIGQAHFGLPWNIDPADPAQAGWAVVLGEGESEAVQTALGPLIDHRRSNIEDGLVKVLDYQPGETWSDWLARHGTGPGNVDPAKVPYYVLLIGSPGRIPFSFQYLLDVEYAVGRLDFDEAADYGRYAEAIIASETGASPPRSKRAAFFATRHPFDSATPLSADRLVRPLAEGDPAAGRAGVAETVGYETSLLLGDAATKDALTEIMTGTGPAQRPGVLFSATHGLGGWPPGHPDQRSKHGALLCQDWPGVGQMQPGQYFAASDLSPDADVGGMVAFLFACYGAGTPERDQFVHEPGMPPPQIADEPFVAALPKSLLAHPAGGALAVIGHIERAWGYSFTSTAGAQLLPFQNALGQIMAGRPVGHAMKDFNEKYAALSTNLSDVLENVSFGKVVPDSELATLWTERNDAQNYAVIGDPAARLRA